jgi:hypothetical protein
MGWEYNAVFPLLIIPGTGPPLSGLYVYSPGVGFGNLVDSIAAAAGFDTPGNAIIRGVATYFPSGSPVFAAALQDGGVLFFQAAGPGGPWVQSGAISADNSNNIHILPAGAGNTILGSGLTAGVPVSISGPESGGVPVVDVTNTSSASAPILRITANAINDLFLGGRVAGDTNARLILDTQAAGNPRIRYGPGNAAPDISLTRSAANTLTLNTADLDIGTAGRGLQVAEGANGRMGVVTLVAGVATVLNTTVTANTRIFLTCQTPGGAPGFLRVSARTAGTSFTVTSSSGTDTSVVGYLMLEPG